VKSSLIFRVSLRFLLPIMGLMVVVIFLRGHHMPGGGFIAGLIGAVAVILVGFAHDTQEVRRRLRIQPLSLVALGLLSAYLSSIIGPLLGHVYMKGVWSTTHFPLVGQLGTPVLFDFGVMIVVIGMAAQILILLKEKQL
jgi:multicomponent Na+:H+ antiporter subunit B